MGQKGCGKEARRQGRQQEGEDRGIQDPVAYKWLL